MIEKMVILRKKLRDDWGLILTPLLLSGIIWLTTALNEENR